jgi:hypothetical protein
VVSGKRLVTINCVQPRGFPCRVLRGNHNCRLPQPATDVYCSHEMFDNTR